jgi:translation initiation factor 4E
LHRLYNNIIPPSQLPQKANYYLFKEGIIPAWEDEANKNGGKWSIQLPKDKNRANVDKMWLYTVCILSHHPTSRLLIAL